MDTKAKSITLKILAPPNAWTIKGGLPAVQKQSNLSSR